MGAAFAHSGPKKKTTKRHFMDLFIPVQKNSVDFSQSVCYLWWDMDPPLYSETKEQWKQWASKDKPAPKKAKAVPSTNKVIATVLGCMWCHIDWLIRKGKNITILYYVTLLDKFNEKINNNKKRPPLGQKKFFFHQDNASLHNVSHINCQNSLTVMEIAAPPTIIIT